MGTLRQGPVPRSHKDAREGAERPAARRLLLAVLLSSLGCAATSPSQRPQPAREAREQGCPAIPEQPATGERPRQMLHGRHWGAITSLQFSPDGALLASAARDGSVRLWDAAHRGELRVWREDMSFLSWLPSGELLFGAVKGDSRVIDVDADRVVRRLSVVPNEAWALRPLTATDPRQFFGNLKLGGEAFFEAGQEPLVLPKPPARDPFNRAHFVSPNGMVVVGAYGSHRDELFIWRRKGRSLQPEPLSIEGVEHAPTLVLNRTGSRAVLVARTGQQHALLLIRTNDGKRLGELPMPKGLGRPAGLALSDDERIVVGIVGEPLSRQGEHLVAWDLEQRKLLFSRQLDKGRQRSFTELVAGMSTPALSPDGRLIAIGNFEGRISLYASDTGRWQGDLGARTEVRSARDVVFEGEQLVVLSRSHVTRWSIRQAAMTDARPVRGAFRLDLGRTGSLVVARGVEYAYDRACGHGVQRLHFDGGGLEPICVPVMRSIGYYDDGENVPHLRLAQGRLAVHGKEGGDLFVVATDGTATVKLAQTHISDDDGCRNPLGVRLSHDGKRVAGQGLGNRLCLWDAATGELLRTKRMEPDAHPRTLRFAPDDSALVAAYGSELFEVTSPDLSVQRRVELGATIGALLHGGARIWVAGHDGSLVAIEGGKVVARGDSDGGAAFRIALSPDRRLVATAHRDGAVRVWDAASARLRASLVGFEDEEWLIATPDGRYKGTLEVGRRMGWVFSSPLERFGFERFDASYRDDEAVERALRGVESPRPGPVHRPPSVRIVKRPTSPRGERAALRVAVAAQGQVTHLRAFAEGRVIASQQVCKRRAELALELPLQDGYNRVSLVAFDDRGFASNEAVIDIQGTKRRQHRTDVWVVAVGVSGYPALAPQFQLNAADDDARGIAKAFAALAGDDYAEAHVTTLIDGQATPKAIRQALAGLRRMKPEDLAVVFFAGHGIKLPGDGEMVFLTGGPARGESRKLSRTLVKRDGVGWGDISRALGGARGRVLVLLDACHSGHVSKELVVPNDDMARSIAGGERAGVIVLAAAKGRQVSLEPALTRGLQLDESERPMLQSSTQAPHGFFTAALLASLQDSDSDRDGDEVLQVSELIAEVRERVSRFTRGKQTPWVARRDLFGDFAVHRYGR